LWHNSPKENLLIPLMQIRLARPEDIAVLSEYWYDQMIIWQQSNTSLQLMPGARREWEQIVTSYLDQPSKIFLVAQTHKEVVGGIIMEATENEPGFAPLQIGVIHALIIDNHTEHGRGAGRLLWDEGIAAMRERGIEQIEIKIPARAAVQQAFLRGVGASHVMDVFWVTI